MNQFTLSKTTIYRLEVHANISAKRNMRIIISRQIQNLRKEAQVRGNKCIALITLDVLDTCFSHQETLFLSFEFFTNDLIFPFEILYKKVPHGPSHLVYRYQRL